MSTSTYFDAAAEAYDDEFGEDSVWAIAHRTARRLLRTHLADRPVGRVLDAGCGTGKWGIPFAVGGADVVFADVAERMVAAAVGSAVRAGAAPDRVHPLTAPVQDMSALADAQFDLTLCMGDPLSYCGDPEAGAAELVRTTRPGGTVLLSVDSRWGYLRVFKERDGYDLDRLAEFVTDGDVVGWEQLPLHAFTDRELRDLMARHGARTVGTWTLPTVSSYFLFDPAFRERLGDADFRRRLDDVEWAALGTGSSSPGSHHLYGLFVREDA